MKTYTISAQERGGNLSRVPIKREKGTNENAMRGAWIVSTHAPLCDIVLTQGSMHVVTYRNGVITALNGKEHKA